MATFGELQVKASARLKDVNNTAVSASDVADVINDAIAQWKLKRFWFNEFEETVTLVQNDPILPALPNGVIPLEIFQEDGIVINYAQSRWPVRKISGSEYDDMNVQGRGIPYAFTQRDDEVELYWYPDAAYSAVVRGLKDYTRFATNGTQNNLSNDFTINAPDLILYETLARLFGEFRQDTKMENYYAARATNQYWNLQRRTRKALKTGRMRVEGF